LLVKEIAAKYNGKVRFVSENFGTSKLAERHKITRYPVVFVNDLLLARPNDFGWFGAKGKYTPWSQAENHEKFKTELAETIDLILRGDSETAARNLGASAKDPAPELASLPSLNVTDIAGQSIASAALSGKIVFAEFWATWCVPCRSTLQWLGELKQKYGDRIEVLAITVESEEAAVRKMIEPMNLPIHVVLGNPGLVGSFGDINSVPTMFIFDGKGKTASIVYGAVDDLHQRVEKTIDPLLK
jgi:thiol-disulfide isomerase/thioredoxin